MLAAKANNVRDVLNVRVRIQEHDAGRIINPASGSSMRRLHFENELMKPETSPEKLDSRTHFQTSGKRLQNPNRIPSAIQTRNRRCDLKPPVASEIARRARLGNLASLGRWFNAAR